MLHLRQNTDQYICIGPALDKGAGFGNEDALTVTSFAGVIVKCTQAAAPSHTPFTPDATGANDWGMAAIGHGGAYALKVPDSEIDYVGSGKILIWYDAEALPMWENFEVLPQPVWDWLYGTTVNLPVDLVKILGTAPTEGGAGRLAAGLTKLFDVATPVFTAASVNQTGDGYAIINGDHGLVSIQDDVDAIKAKTDNLTFTSGTDLDVNVQKVNDAALTGDGSALTPWGPA